MTVYVVQKGTGNILGIYDTFEKAEAVRVASVFLNLVVRTYKVQ